MACCDWCQEETEPELLERVESMERLCPDCLQQWDEIIEEQDIL
jgi:hypothetical protein